MKYFCIILDYNDGKIKYFEVEKGATTEEIEEILFTELELKESQIEWMKTEGFNLEKIDVEDYENSACSRVVHWICSECGSDHDHKFQAVDCCKDLKN